MIVYDCFNPSRGIAIIQTIIETHLDGLIVRFQSLTRDSNHSNHKDGKLVDEWKSFNPSRGIAIIQTVDAQPKDELGAVSIPHAG